MLFQSCLVIYKLQLYSVALPLLYVYFFSSSGLNDACSSMQYMFSILLDNVFVCVCSCSVLEDDCKNDVEL